MEWGAAEMEGALTFYRRPVCDAEAGEVPVVEPGQV